MNELMKSVANPFLMWCFGILGDALLIIGIIVTIKGETIVGFTPVIWFLLAIISYLIMVWIVTMRILVHIESFGKD